MLKLTGSVYIESSIKETWSYLSDLERISEWSEIILSAECTGENKRGVGAERVCNLKNNIKITEKMVAWENERTFTYQALGLPLVKIAENKWSLEESNGITKVVSESVVILRGGALGRVLEPLMSIMSKRMCLASLASFKYLVENGGAYEGKHSELPTDAVSC